MYRSWLARLRVVCEYDVMQRITLSVPEELAGLLKREARRRGSSVSKVACIAIDRYLRGSEDEIAELPFIGLGQSGHRHTGRDAEKILASEWPDVGDR